MKKHVGYNITTCKNCPWLFCDTFFVPHPRCMKAFRDLPSTFYIPKIGGEWPPLPSWCPLPDALEAKE